MNGRAEAGSARAYGKPWHVRLRLKPLEGWITLGEAAEDLGISRQAVHRLVERGTLKAKTVGRRPIIVVQEKDVRALPISPQRSRELRSLSSGEGDLGDELPEG
jgi:excisionase family DNA binding protein